MADSPPIGVRFNRFWSGFDAQEFFIPLLAHALGVPTGVTLDRRAQVSVDSVFSTRVQRLFARAGFKPSLRISPSQPTALRLWFSGENVRPPATGYDLTLSFDLDDYGGLNQYLPLILLGLDWFPTDSSRETVDFQRAGISLRPSDVHLPREHSLAGRPGFVCAFIGRWEPTRYRAIEALSRYGDVDVFGRAVGRPIRSKFEVARKYKFMLCFENDRYPGYVTEKALEAYACGCVPLWWGEDAAGLLNSEALINAADFASLASFAECVRDLAGSPMALDAMARRSLFRSPPTLKPTLLAIAAAAHRKGLP